MFAALTVEENLRVARSGSEKPGIEAAYELFPQLEWRKSDKGSAPSGGERQMQSTAGALQTGSGVPLPDEPFEGLAPAIVEQPAETLQLLRRTKGIGRVLVERRADSAVDMAGGGPVPERGRPALRGDANRFGKAGAASKNC